MLKHTVCHIEFIGFMFNVLETSMFYVNAFYFYLKKCIYIISVLIKTQPHCTFKNMDMAEVCDIKYVI